MAHLAGRAIPCPQPIADRQGRAFSMLCGKPATLVTRLPGRDVEYPNAMQCAAVGAMLARMHAAAADYPDSMPNPRGLAWWRAAALEVLPHMPAAEAQLLQAELEHQSRARHRELPQGAIHADLFRDNVLFEADAVGGVIDFYFACTDRLLFDVAVAVNDWCIEPDGTLEPARARALLAAYQEVRPFSAAERHAWPDLLRAGALRFWVSRLFDFHCPRPGELTFAKDPAHFRRILQARIARGEALCELLGP
jgi:homoserine kinase type II